MVSSSLFRIKRTRKVNSFKLTHLPAKKALTHSTTRLQLFPEHNWSKLTDWPVKRRVLAMEPTLASTLAVSTLTMAFLPEDSTFTSSAPLATTWSLWARHSKIFLALWMLPLILDSEFTAVKTSHSLNSQQHSWPILETTQARVSRGI